MIRTIKIDLNAAYPNMPLDPVSVFAGSAASFTICNVPRAVGDRSVTGVKLQFKLPGGQASTATAVRVGSAWEVTIPNSALSTPYSATLGVKVVGMGTDENKSVCEWVLGVADLQVLNAQGQVTPGAEAGDVCHKDFENVAGLTNATLNETSAKVNEILNKLKGVSALLVALAVSVANSALLPTTPIGDVPPTNTIADVVTAGGGGGGGVDTNAVRDLIAETCVTNGGAKAYADTKLSRYGSDYGEEGPRINWESGNIKLYGGAKAYFPYDVVFMNWDRLGIGPDAIYKNQTLPQYLASTSWHGENKTLGDYGITNTIPDVSGMSAEVASISNRQDSLEGYIAGQRVRVSVTNYYGNTSGQLPRLRIEEFITATNEVGGVATETNYWQTVWDEQNKYDRFLSDATTAIAAMTNNLYQTYYQLLQERLATKAPRAWGTLTSAGEAAPAGSVWHTEPNTVFAGGTEYAHAMVGTGVIGVLTTRGAAVYTDGETGRFHFTTDDKTAYFGMNIASRYELGCATDGITVTQVGGNQMVDLLYNVTMSGKPILYYTPSITNIVWEQITDSSGGAIPGASVYASWDQSAPAGSEICTINCGQGISGFFKASIEYAGVSKFETNMMADLAGGIIATNQTTNQSQPVEPYISNGAVFWRVKQ